MQEEQIDRDDQPELQPPSPAPGAASDPPPAQSTWPVVLGLVAALFGLAGFLNNLLSVASPFFMEWFLAGMPGELSGEAQEGIRAAREIMGAFRGWTVGFGLVSAVVSAVLLIGGIMLLLRRADAARLLRAWAIVRMIMVTFGAIVSWRIQQYTFATLHETLGAEMDQVPAGLIAVTTGFGMTVGIIFGWALPVIVLIWFARQKIKDEVEGWR
jgi:hypothetical protein